MIPVQCVILFTKISRIGNKVVCLYSGNFRLNYVFIQLQKERHICLILLLYFLLHQRSFLNFVVKNFQDGFQYFIFELCFCILIFRYVVGDESGFMRWSSPEGGDPEQIRIQAQHTNYQRFCLALKTTFFTLYLSNLNPEGKVSSSKIDGFMANYISNFKWI